MSAFTGCHSWQELIDSVDHWDPPTHLERKLAAALKEAVSDCARLRASLSAVTCLKCGQRAVAPDGGGFKCRECGATEPCLPASATSSALQRTTPKNPPALSGGGKPE